MGFDFVAQDEVGAGVAGLGLVELVAEGGERLVRRGAVSGSRRMSSSPWPGMMSPEVSEGFADEGVCLVAGAGVVAVRVAGEGGFGVVGGHPDGVGDLLDLGFQADHVRGQVAEPDPGGDRCRGLPGFFQFPVCGLGGGVELVEDLVGDGDACPGLGCAVRAAGVAGGLGGCGEGFGAADLGGSGFLRRVGDQPVGSSGVAAWESRASRAKWVRA